MVACTDGFGTWAHLVTHVNPVFLLVLEQVTLQRSLLSVQFAEHKAEIAFMQLAVFHLGIQYAQGRRVFGGDDNTARVAVDAVDECGGKRLLAGGIIFPFFIEIPFDAGDEGINVFVLVRMAEKPCFFVSSSRFSSS